MHRLITVAILMASSMQLIAMEGNLIGISGIDKPKLLQALFYKAKSQGNGRADYNPYQTLSTEEAKIILEHKKGKIDYLHGRLLKVDLSGNVLDVRQFNRDNGAGMAQAAIQGIDLFADANKNPRGLILAQMIREELDKEDL